MPNLDGTGPQGLGPMTGRRFGRCVAKGSVELQKTQVIGEPGEIYGLGRGGRPYGGGRGNCFGGGQRGMGRGRRFGR
jgi:hypothetical protein